MARYLCVICSAQLNSYTLFNQNSACPTLNQRSSWSIQLDQQSIDSISVCFPLPLLETFFEVVEYWAKNSKPVTSSCLLLYRKSLTPHQIRGAYLLRAPFHQIMHCYQEHYVKWKWKEGPCQEKKPLHICHCCELHDFLSGQSIHLTYMSCDLAVFVVASIAVSLFEEFCSLSVRAWERYLYIHFLLPHLFSQHVLVTLVYVYIVDSHSSQIIFYPTLKYRLSCFLILPFSPRKPHALPYHHFKTLLWHSTS